MPSFAPRRREPGQLPESMLGIDSGGRPMGMGADRRHAQPTTIAPRTPPCVARPWPNAPRFGGFPPGLPCFGRWSGRERGGAGPETGGESNLDERNSNGVLDDSIRPPGSSHPNAGESNDHPRDSGQNAGRPIHNACHSTPRNRNSIIRDRDSILRRFHPTSRGRDSIFRGCDSYFRGRDSNSRGCDSTFRGCEGEIVGEFDRFARSAGWKRRSNLLTRGGPGSKGRCAAPAAARTDRRGGADYWKVEEKSRP